MRAPFEGETHAGDGVRFRFTKSDGRYLVEQLSDGLLILDTVVWTIGWSPLQQYLVARPTGLQILPIAWDGDSARWFEPFPSEPPGTWLHWLGAGREARTQCLSCHVTGWKVPEGRDVLGAIWSEASVGCESCHGAGGQHVDWAQRGFLGEDPYRGGKTVAGRSESCLPCHTRATPLSDKPGSLHDGHLVEIQLPPRTHSDGQIREELFEGGPFSTSAMHHAGVRCIDCHEPHAARPRAEGNALCLRCHDGALATPSHTGHGGSGPGTRCTDCHMRTTTYMGNDARHDHGFHIPRPDLASLGVPNACADCHTDRSASWATERLRSWHGPWKHLDGPTAVSAARTRLARWHVGELPDASLLLSQVQDTALPEGLRAASALALAGGAEGSSSVPDAFVQAWTRALQDRSAAVRSAAAQAIASLPDPQASIYLRDALDDSAGSVRIVAALRLRGLVPLPAELVQAVEAHFRLVSRLPGGRLNLAAWAFAGGDERSFRAHLDTARLLDPHSPEIPAMETWIDP